MIRKEIDTFTTPPIKKLRFRNDLNFENRIEDLFEDADKRKSRIGEIGSEDPIQKEKPEARQKSFFDFIKIELTRGYVLEHDEERYSARREKIYNFMTIPRELEKFMIYGVLQCVDSFLYIHTFLPIRYLLALWGVIWRPIATCFGLRRRGQRFLAPAEICDLLKGTIWILSTWLIIMIDTNRMYHIIKSQSVIKLYIFYNMLEVGDRLLSAFEKLPTSTTKQDKNFEQVQGQLRIQIVWH
ncbi:Protein TAPT1 like [Pseudolycoriella hygida]|uniref:Protein TAPT1 like n=1 Tax=Pseudolycoriella hygida TaxID=35572 RepID=A0A9Q0MRQ9_9DIPT|nr:Protein TAPT1 like [Pseudolycoriella hygida]